MGSRSAVIIETLQYARPDDFSGVMAKIPGGPYQMKIFRTQTSTALALILSLSMPALAQE